MKLTAKDKAFLRELRCLMEARDLFVDTKCDGYTRLVLRKNYGDAIERQFRMTRQGVRWRFHRIFSEIYPSAYETILLIEGHFGTRLRQAAMTIARERYDLWRKAQPLQTLPTVLHRNQEAQNDGQHQD